MNCSIPVGSSTTRLTSSHRSASRATCATGWRRNPSPKRRRSTTNTAPPIKANPIRWILATTGKSHDELRIAESSGEYWTHSQKSNKDIRNSCDSAQPQERAQPSIDEGDEGTQRGCCDAGPAMGTPPYESEGGYRESVIQPASKLTIAGWGCFLQSNQYTWYGIMRPNMIRTAHVNRARPPRNLALRGGTGSRSHSATLRYTVL